MYFKILYLVSMSDQEKEIKPRHIWKKGLLAGSIGVGLAAVVYFVKKGLINHAENYEPYQLKELLGKITRRSASKNPDAPKE